MGSLNKVMLIGNLGKDPDYKQVSGKSLATFSIATNRTWKDANGEQKKETTWHRIVAWGKQAETCGRYLTKGKQVYVEGRLQTRKWTDKDGNEKYTTEINLSNMVMLGRKDDAEDAGGGDDMPHDGGPPPADDEVPF